MRFISDIVRIRWLSILIYGKAELLKKESQFSDTVVWSHKLVKSKTAVTPDHRFAMYKSSLSLNISKKLPLKFWYYGKMPTNGNLSIQQDIRPVKLTNHVRYSEQIDTMMPKGSSLKDVWKSLKWFYWTDNCGSNLWFNNCHA